MAIRDQGTDWLIPNTRADGNVCTKCLPLIIHPPWADLIFGSISQDTGKLQHLLWVEETRRGEEWGSSSCFTVSCCHGGSPQGQIAVLLLHSRGMFFKERFISWANILHGPPLATVITCRVCWDAFFSPPCQDTGPCKDAGIFWNSHWGKAAFLLEVPARGSRNGGWGPKYKQNTFYLYSTVLTLTKEMLVVFVVVLPHAFCVLSPVHSIGHCPCAHQKCFSI